MALQNKNVALPRAIETTESTGHPFLYLGKFKTGEIENFIDSFVRLSQKDNKFEPIHWAKVVENMNNIYFQTILKQISNKIHDAIDNGFLLLKEETGEIKLTEKTIAILSEKFLKK